MMVSSMNAVIYARYSSHNQREESIEGQLRECHDFAEKNGFIVLHEYCDRAISGKTDHRPEFQKMIRDSEKGKFQAVILYTLDRFARNRYDSALYKAKLKKNGVKLYYAKQPMPDTPEGIILESVLEGYAEYYSENLSRSIKRGMKENALHATPTGPQPLGYTTENKKIVIDPVGAKAVKLIFELYAQGKSRAEICRIVNEKGFRTRNGTKFVHNSVGKILKNERYIGTYKYDDVVIENAVPAIIDRQLFEQVQSKIKHNSAARAKNKAKQDYLLSTKLFCGHCGNPMIGESGRSKSGTIYNYYKCSGRKRHLTDCDKKTEKKEVIEKLVVEYTIKKVLTDENIDLISTRAMELIQKEIQDTSMLAALENQLSDVNKRINNVMSAIEQGIITSTTKERLEELESERLDVETQIARENIKKPSITKGHIEFWLYSFKDGDINDVSYQERIIDALVNRVYVYDDNGGKRIVIIFNISGENTLSIQCSDIEGVAPPDEMRKAAEINRDVEIGGFFST